MTTRNEQEMARAFRAMNRYFMVPLWRSGLGKLLNIWPEVGGRIMVIVHRGRRSGRTYTTPVNYAPVDGELYCLAGFGGTSDWYKNLIATPQCEVWLPEGWWQAAAEDVSELPDRPRLMRAVLIGSGFAARVFGINPHTLSDEELDEVTKDYRLLRIRRTAPQTGPGGPGEYAWVWHITTVLLLALLLLRPRRRR
jgi:deazaflavin-dependent oxidoreductase (nitroreductase family)